MQMENVVRGYDIVKVDWDASNGEKFDMKLKQFNEQDILYAVAVRVDGETVGHLPIEA